LSNGAYRLASHLFNSSKYVLYSCSGFGTASVAPLLTFRERFVRISFSLYLVAIAVLFQPGFPLFGGVTAICIDIFAGVPFIEDVFKVLAIMPTGCVGLDLPDYFVFLIYVDGEFVTIVVFAIFFGPAGAAIFLTTLGWFPVARNRFLPQ